MTGTSDDTPRMSVTSGETIAEHRHESGAVVAEVSDIERGEETQSVEITAGNLRNAVDTDLQDSYDTVYIWCDGQTAAVTDHRKPIKGEDATGLDTFTEPLARTDVVEPTDDAVRTAVERNYARTAIDEFERDEKIEMLVDQDWPLVLVGEEKSVGIAPITRPEDLPSRRGGAVA